MDETFFSYVGFDPSVGRTYPPSAKSNPNWIGLTPAILSPGVVLEMSNIRRRLAPIGSVVVLAIAVQLIYGAALAKATPSSTTATTPGPTTTSSGRTAPAASPDCKDVLAGGESGSLFKDLATGGNEQLGFDVFRIQTGRPAGIYHVVDCVRADQVFPNPAVITTVDLGDIQVSGTARLRVSIPRSAVPGSDVCDRFVVSGLAGGEPFTDISNEACTIYSSCLFFGPGPCPPPLPTTGGVASTTPHRGTLPFTGTAAWPLLITSVALFGLGVASLLVARRRHDRATR